MTSGKGRVISAYTGRVPQSVKQVYAVGTAAEAVIGVAFNFFNFFFYTNIMGVSGTLRDWRSPLRYFLMPCRIHLSALFPIAGAPNWEGVTPSCLRRLFLLWLVSF